MQFLNKLIYFMGLSKFLDLYGNNPAMLLQFWYLGHYIRLSFLRNKRHDKVAGAVHWSFGEKYYTQRSKQW